MFGHIASPNCQHCGVPEDNYHIFHDCRNFNDARHPLKDAICKLNKEPFSLKTIPSTSDLRAIKKEKKKTLEFFYISLEDTALIGVHIR